MRPESLGQVVKNQVRILRNLIYHRVYVSSGEEQEIVDRFHRFYYDLQAFGKTWANTPWLGVQTSKLPFDLFIYQELIFQVRPDLIIECGTALGGSALFFASICDLVDHGQVVSIDIEHREGRPEHPRIKYLLGSTVSEDIVAKVKAMAHDKDQVLVSLDSDHSKGHVLKELEIYSQFVSLNSYMVVEDTNVNGHPVAPEFGPGPMEALQEFLKVNHDFIVDKTREKFYLTFNPQGYLRKIQ
jgi:cephalosporin hydroxylase